MMHLKTKILRHIDGAKLAGAEQVEGVVLLGKRSTYCSRELNVLVRTAELTQGLLTC
jgi:hypothetical protein